jgi:hypothetical protein
MSRTDAAVAPSLGREPQHDVAQNIFASPYLWGGLLTFGFYKLIPHVPVYREFLERYCAGHPLEYAEVAMFFVGLSILAVRLLRLNSERQALDAFTGTGDAAEAGGEPAKCIALIEGALQRLPRRLRGTELGRRLRDVAGYVRSRQSARGLEERVKYLDQLAGDRLHDGYALLQNITWAIPILGFLGTVVGITMAIANVTPDQLDSALKEVTGGLAIAFDTTALALALSVVLVFTYYFVKRGEMQVLESVAQISLLDLLALFPETAAAGHPLLEAETRAAEQLLERTESLIHKQTGLWQESVESLRTRWTSTLESQQQQLAQSLQTATGQTLDNHSESLAGLREEFIAAYRDVSRELTAAVAASQQVRREQDADLVQRLEQLWQQMRVGLEHARLAREGQIDRHVKPLMEKMTGWQSQLEQATLAVHVQMETLRQQGELLGRIVAQEEDLAGLEQKLTANLEALRAAETFEQTLHSLSAAVHLLTARTHARAA